MKLDNLYVIVFKSNQSLITDENDTVYSSFEKATKSKHYSGKEDMIIPLRDYIDNKYQDGKNSMMTTFNDYMNEN